MFHEVTSGLREQHLPPVPGTHDARSAVNVQADVVFSGELRLTRVQAYTHTYCHTLRPYMGSQGTLHVHCCPDSIGGARKGHEEGITLRVHLVAVPLLKCCT